MLLDLRERNAHTVTKTKISHPTQRCEVRPFVDNPYSYLCPAQQGLPGARVTSKQAQVAGLFLELKPGLQISYLDRGHEGITARAVLLWFQWDAPADSLP